jgi:hypothetical protein
MREGVLIPAMLTEGCVPVYRPLLAGGTGKGDKEKK